MLSIMITTFIWLTLSDSSRGGGGLLPYLGYIGMCGAKGYGFQPFFLNDKVPILNILVLNRVWFVHPSLELGMFLRRIYFLIIRR